MAKTRRKINKKLDARTRDYRATCERLENIKTGSSRGYRKPGSMNPTK